MVPIPVQIRYGVWSVADPHHVDADPYHSDANLEH